MILFVGFNLTFFPQFILGYMGMPRRYHSYPPEFQVFNVLSTAGASILASAICCRNLSPLVDEIWEVAGAIPGRRRASSGRCNRRR